MVEHIAYAYPKFIDIVDHVGTQTQRDNAHNRPTSAMFTHLRPAERQLTTRQHNRTLFTIPCSRPERTSICRIRWGGEEYHAAWGSVGLAGH